MTKATYTLGTFHGSPFFAEIEISADGRLSICGMHQSGGGQNHDTLRAMITEGATWAPGWSREMAAQLLDVWERWHLNDMHAGCSHQRALGWGNGFDVAITKQSATPAQRRVLEAAALKAAERAREAARKAYREGMSRGSERARLWHRLCPGETFSTYADEQIRDFAAGHKTRHNYPEVTRFIEALDALIEREHPPAPIESVIFKDSLSAPCPECGYRYGTAWLREDLPAGVIAFLQGLPSADTRSPYDITAEAFLARFGLTFHADHAQAKDGLASRRQHWRVTLKNGGARSINFDFWNSEHDTAKGKRLTPYSVLACLSSDVHYTDADELIRELGCDRKQAAAAVRFARRLQKFFTEAEIAALGEIR